MVSAFAVGFIQTVSFWMLYFARHAEAGGADDLDRSTLPGSAARDMPMGMR